MKAHTQAIVYLLILFNVLMMKSWAMDAMPVETLQLKKQSAYVQTRTFVGRVEAQRISNSSFELSGMISKMYYDEGDRVSSGDTLAKLDQKHLLARKTEIEASLLEAKAGLKLAEATLKRVSNIAKQRLIDQQSLDEARETRDVAAAKLEQIKARLSIIKLDLEKSVLKAPFSGTIIQRNHDEGDVVAVGQQVFELQETTEYLARIGISNDLSNRFTNNQSIKLVVNNQAINAQIKAILPVRNRSTRTVDVIFTLENTSVRPGDLVSWSLEQTIKREGFWVPLTALTEGIRGLWNVYVVNDDKRVELRPVEIIHQTSHQAYVRGLLNENEPIVSNGMQRIVPNQSVRLVNAIQEGQ